MNINATNLLLAHIRAYQLPEPVLEHQFHPTRKWRFDLAWPSERVKISVEIQGGVYGTRPKGKGFRGDRAPGRHTRAKGYEGDREKSFNAQLLGWIAIEVTPQQIEKGIAVTWIQEAFYKRYERDTRMKQTK